MERSTWKYHEKVKVFFQAYLSIPWTHWINTDLLPDLNQGGEIWSDPIKQGEKGEAKELIETHWYNEIVSEGWLAHPLKYSDPPNELLFVYRTF